MSRQSATIRIMHARVFVGMAVVLGFVIGLVASLSPPAEGSRNSSGTYSLPAGNPVVSGTAISSATHNSTMSDIATELTNSLDRAGRGAMTAPLQLSSGSAALPGLTFSSDTDSGFYRVGANDVAISAGATKSQGWTSSGTTIPGTLGVTGATTLTGTLTANGTVTSTNKLDASSADGDFALTATGGTSHAVVATGGSSDGVGVIGNGGTTNGRGGLFTGAGTGDGIRAVGGSAGGTAVIAIGGSVATGGIFSNGTAATATTARNALEVSNGYLGMAGVTAPNSNVAFTNVLTPKNIIKAWGHFLADGAGGISISDGFNLTSVSLGGAQATVTMASAMSSTNYAIVCMGNLAPSLGGPATTTTFVFSSSGLSLATNSQRVFCMVVGAQ